jgi:hypothetical protein
MNIGLVSCSKRKLDRPWPARELYSASAFFRKARAYCERHYDSWYILSAKHGLVHPDEVLAPYDLTLKRMPVAERRAWGRRVSADLRALGDHVFYPHAGKDYLEYVSGVKLVNVLEGLRQGERLRWYNEQAAKEVRK